MQAGWIRALPVSGKRVSHLGHYVLAGKGGKQVLQRLLCTPDNHQLEAVIVPFDTLTLGCSTLYR